MNSQKDSRIKRAAMRCRMDLIQEIISFDRESGRLEGRMLPDPRRHVKIESDEPGTWYLDKYLNESVRREDMARSMSGVPIFGSARTVSSASEYAQERRSALENELATGEYTAPREAGRPHTPLTKCIELNHDGIQVEQPEKSHAVPMSLKKAAPFLGAIAGVIMAQTFPIVWSASICLILLLGLAVAMWRRGWLKWKQGKEKRDPGSSPG